VLEANSRAAGIGSEFQDVVEGDCLEHGIDLVVAVGPPTANP
jgi:hypothetical protein